jgi:hypothetical protein
VRSDSIVRVTFARGASVSERADLMITKRRENYNALQVAWTPERGKLSFNANYTFSKARGLAAERKAPMTERTSSTPSGELIRENS